MTVDISKWGNSSGIRIPKQYLEQLDWKDNDELEISLKNEVIVIRKSHKQRTLRQIIEEETKQKFEEYLEQNSYDFEEIDWGNPVGNEVW